MIRFADYLVEGTTRQLIADKLQFVANNGSTDSLIDAVQEFVELKIGEGAQFAVKAALYALYAKGKHINNDEIIDYGPIYKKFALVLRDKKAFTREMKNKWRIAYNLVYSVGMKTLP